MQACSSLATRPWVHPSLGHPAEDGGKEPHPRLLAPIMPLSSGHGALLLLGPGHETLLRQKFWSLSAERETRISGSVNEFFFYSKSLTRFSFIFFSLCPALTFKVCKAFWGSLERFLARVACRENTAFPQVVFSFLCPQVYFVLKYLGNRR